MKLTSARITNYRSVEDSGEMSLEQVTCLVGKNEAGKTAICMALTGFNPHSSTPMKYEIERDYPRRHLNDYAERHGDKDATVISTIWELGEEEIRDIEGQLCPSVLKNPFVTGVRTYNSEAIEWSADIDYERLIKHLVSEAGFDEEEMTQIGSPEVTDDLRKALEKIDERSIKQQALLDHILALPGKNAAGAVRALSAIIYLT